MAMTVKEVASKKIRKGAFYDIAWKRSVGTLKSAGNVAVFKATKMVGQFGVDFDNKSSVDWEAYNNAHERGGDNGALKFEWVIPDLVGRYLSNGREFLRVNTVDGAKPKTVWTKVENGVETVIDKAEAESLCGSKAKSSHSNDSGCISVPLENITSFARKH